jgi:hypothetical protein
VKPSPVLFMFLSLPCSLQPSRRLLLVLLIQGWQVPHPACRALIRLGGQSPVLTPGSFRTLDSTPSSFSHSKDPAHKDLNRRPAGAHCPWNPAPPEVPPIKKRFPFYWLLFHVLVLASILSSLPLELHCLLHQPIASVLLISSLPPIWSWVPQPAPAQSRPRLLLVVVVAVICVLSRANCGRGE